MLTLIFTCGLLNMIGGRDLLGSGVKGEKGIFRAILPSLLVAATYYKETSDVLTSLYVLAVLIAGSYLWCSPNWSFDEINGDYDAKKYPLFIKRIGLYFYPLVGGMDGKSVDGHPSNYKRGIIMKGLRGMYDYPLYAALMAVNPWAALTGLATGAMGLIYWACGRVVKGERYDVLTSEFVHGMFRWFLIITTLFNTLKGDNLCVF